MSEQADLIIDVTSAALSKPGAADWMRQAVELAGPYNCTIGVQVHNSASAEELDLAAKSGFPLSFHAPVLGKYMMNLAAEDASVSWQMIDEQVALMRQYNVKRAVFHAALMTDQVVYAFGHGMTYQECMRQVERPELQRGNGCVFSSNYTGCEEYLMRRERLKENLKKLRQKYPQFCWCVENDFPAFVAGVLRGEDLVALEHEVCFDTGHMWATCKMLDLDFYREMRTVLESGRAGMIHLHSSRYTFDMPHHLWGDGHLPLNHPTTMDVAQIIRCCRQNKLKHIVLEIADASPDDIKTVLQYYFEE